jgi:hypothetical protein
MAIGPIPEIDLSPSDGPDDYQEWLVARASRGLFRENAARPLWRSIRDIEIGEGPVHPQQIILQTRPLIVAFLNREGPELPALAANGGTFTAQGTRHAAPFKGCS